MISNIKIESLLRNIKRTRAKVKLARRKEKTQTVACLLRGKELAFSDIEKRLRKILTIK